MVLARRTLTGVSLLVVLTDASISSQQSSQPIALAERPGGDSVLGVVADGDGGVWIAGRTNNGIVASVDALQPQPGGNDDAFVTHVGPDGSVLYSTYLGGSGVDVAYGIARDATGKIYVAGGTNSTNFPVTPDAYRT